MNEFITNDKIYAPFLLAASFNGLLKYAGSFIQNNLLFWQFYPREDAKSLIEQLHTRNEPYIPSMDLFEATTAWWKQIAELRNKNGEINYGKS